MHVRPPGPVFRLPLRISPRPRGYGFPALLFSTAAREGKVDFHYYGVKMFKKAVAAHVSPVTSQDSLARQLFHSSSPNTLDALLVKEAPQQAQLQRNPRATNVLLPSGLTKLNGRDRIQLATSTAVKRTSSGLIKTVGGGIDDFGDMASLTRAPTNSHKLPAKGSTDINDLFFNENDFDSDIDLDIEDPVSKNSVRYPKLPSSNPGHKPVTYPSIQTSQFHSLSPAKASHVTPADLHEPAPPSSVPLPWSSSPPEHKNTPPRNTFAAYTYTNDNVQRARAAQVPGSLTEATAHTTLTRYDPPAPPVNRPSKRRTLPWLETQESYPSTTTASSITHSNLSSRRTQSTSLTTPSRGNSEAPLYSWNTTASALKEQQKQLRKMNKKVSMEMEGTEEAKALAMGKIKNGRVSRPCLSGEQRQVLDLVVDQGQSVFFTGSAGTGKSVLLRETIAVLRKKFSKEPDRVAITASTGLAACNIGGVTLHSFSGIGLGKEEVPVLVKKIKKNQKAMHRWLRTKYLIVDEISMVDADLFDKLEEIARQLRKNGRPFGGIKLVITGDFFQLPPVPDSGKIAKFCFDAKTWSSSIDHTIGLHHVFRQKDPVFAGMLNEMREGRLTQNSINTFRALSRPLTFRDEITATELFPTRNEVEAANSTRMHQLQGDVQTYEARDSGTIFDKQQRDKLLQNCMAPEVLKLKKGSQVMLIKNIDEMLVNGSLGQVVGFMNEATFDSYNAEPDRFHEITTAKEEDLNPVEQIMKRTLSAYANTSQVWPMVRFTLADGNTRDLLCSREPWKIELPNGEVQAARSQVPLILAWALSIHKAQGQTLERVKVDLGKVFEKGQAYVALSRATSMQGLQVLRFDPKKVVAHDRVRTFYASLSRAEHASKGEVVNKDV